MRLLQRLAAGMCERRTAELRQTRHTVGKAARVHAWADVPSRVRWAFNRAAQLKQELEGLEAEITRAGYYFTDYNLVRDVRGHEPRTFKDAEKREKAAQAVVDKRIEKVQRLKERALRDLLGVGEKDGKKYLDRFEQELQEGC